MKIRPVLFILLVAGVVAAQSCKWLFKSDYAELKAADLTAFVEARFPEMYKVQFAQDETMRKRLIDNFKKSFAFAQAAEDAGIHKSDEFKKRLELGIEQLLATKYTERNPDVIISKEEWEAYYASHKDQFDAHLKFITANSEQPITDDQKEQEREIWSQTKTRAEKARQAGLDKEPWFAALVKFGKADLLANLYVQSLKEKNKFTDAEREKYRAENPGADSDKLNDKVKLAMEDATLKYPVNAPTDFIVNVAGSDGNRVPGAGQGGSVNPGENK
ncbi:MAG: hypothetical protein ACREA2_20605 [Blastocatellia bacterium]